MADIHGQDAGASPAAVPTASLALANSLAALRPMSDWLDQQLAAMGVAPLWRGRFDLCANEAVANAISYGYDEGQAGEVVLRLFRAGAAVTLEIEDDARPYDPLARPPHTPPASLDLAPIGGLGVDLVRALMGQCTYERRAGRNVLRLTAGG